MWPLANFVKPNGSTVNVESLTKKVATQHHPPKPDTANDSDADSYVSISSTDGGVSTCDIDSIESATINFAHIPKEVLQDEFAARQRGSELSLAYSLRLPGAHRFHGKDTGPANRLSTLRMYEAVIQMSDEELDKECLARGLLATPTASVAERCRKDVHRDIATLQRARARRDEAEEDLKIMTDRLWAWTYTGSEESVEKLVGVIQQYGI